MARPHEADGWVFFLTESTDAVGITRTVAHIYLPHEQRCVDYVVPLGRSRLRVGAKLSVGVFENSRRVQTYHDTGLRVTTELVGGQHTLSLRNVLTVIGWEFDMEESPECGKCWAKQIGLCFVDAHVAVRDGPLPGFLHSAWIKCDVEWLPRDDGEPGLLPCARWTIEKVQQADWRLSFWMTLDDQPPASIMVFLYDLPRWQDLPTGRREAFPVASISGESDPAGSSSTANSNNASPPASNSPLPTSDEDLAILLYDQPRLIFRKGALNEWAFFQRDYYSGWRQIEFDRRDFGVKQGTPLWGWGVIVSIQQHHIILWSLLQRQNEGGCIILPQNLSERARFGLDLYNVNVGELLYVWVTPIYHFGADFDSLQAGWLARKVSDQADLSLVRTARGRNVASELHTLVEKTEIEAGTRHVIAWLPFDVGTWRLCQCLIANGPDEITPHSITTINGTDIFAPNDFSTTARGVVAVMKELGFFPRIYLPCRLTPRLLPYDGHFQHCGMLALQYDVEEVLENAVEDARNH